MLQEMRMNRANSIAFSLSLRRHKVSSVYWFSVAEGSGKVVRWLASASIIDYLTCVLPYEYQVTFHYFRCR